MNNTLKKLSKITGVSTLHIKELLNLNLDIDDDYVLSCKEIEQLGFSLFEFPNFPLSRFIILVDGIAYRGTLIRSEGRGRIVVYSDESGERHSKIIEWLLQILIFIV